MAAIAATVLIVEDSDDIRRLMKMVLEIKGYRVLEAINGRQAVERAPLEKPDLILMDLSMPVLNGWEATRQLRLLDETRETPIVAVSAYCGDAKHEDALAAGCNACMHKPIDNQKLDEILSRFLRVRVRQSQ